MDACENRIDQNKERLAAAMSEDAVTFGEEELAEEGADDTIHTQAVMPVSPSDVSLHREGYENQQTNHPRLPRELQARINQNIPVLQQLSEKWIEDYKSDPSEENQELAERGKRFFDFQLDCLELQSGK